MELKIEFIPYPDDPRIGVSECGKLYNYKTRKILKQHILKTGYYSVLITSPGIPPKAYRVHRVLLKTFLPIDDSDNYFVNHIDGNKINNSLDNLEWVTPLDNVEHALNNNLWNTLRPVQRKNILTGEVVVIRSIGQAALEGNIHLATLAKHLNSDGAGTYDYAGYAYRFINDLTWPIIGKRKRCDIVVKCINITNNELHVFDSMISASKYCGINYRRLNHYLVTRGEVEYIHNEWRITL